MEMLENDVAMTHYLHGRISIGGYFLYRYLSGNKGEVSSTIRKAGKTLYLSSNTLRRYIKELEEKGIITYQAIGRDGFKIAIIPPLTVSKIDTVNDESCCISDQKDTFCSPCSTNYRIFSVSKFDTVGENSSEKQFIVSKIDTVESSTVSKIDTVKRGIVSKFDTVNDEDYGISANNSVFCSPCSTNYRIFSVSKIDTVKNLDYKEKEKKVIKEKDKEKEKEKEKESTKEKEKEKEKEITKENYLKKEKEIVYAKNQKIHDSKQSTLLNNGTMVIHSTEHENNPINQPTTSLPLNDFSFSRAKLPVGTTKNVPPAKNTVPHDNQQDMKTESENSVDNQDVMFDLDNNSIGKYGFKAYSGTKGSVEYRSGVSISKSKNNAQNGVKKANGSVFGAVQFRQCLVDNGVDGQVADDYMSVRRAKKGVFTKTAFTLLLNEVQRHNISLNDAVLTCIDRNWIAYNHEWVLKLEFQYVNGVKLERKFNPYSPPVSSKPKMTKNENGTFTIRKG